MIAAAILAACVALTVFLAVRSPKTMLALLAAWLAGAAAFYVAAGQGVIVLRPEVRSLLGLPQARPTTDAPPAPSTVKAQPPVRRPAPPPMQVLRGKPVDMNSLPGSEPLPGDVIDPGDLANDQPIWDSEMKLRDTSGAEWDEAEEARLRKLERDQSRAEDMKLRRERVRQRRGR